MEATLVYLVLHVADPIVSEVLENFRENPFQCVVARLTDAGRARLLNGVVLVIADVERRAVEMATVVGGIAIMLAQAEDIVLGTRDGGDDNLAGIDVLYILGV